MILADFLLPGSVSLKRIWIRIRLTKMKRIQKDPDPQHCRKVSYQEKFLTQREGSKLIVTWHERFPWLVGGSLVYVCCVSSQIYRKKRTTPSHADTWQGQWWGSGSTKSLQCTFRPLGSRSHDKVSYGDPGSLDLYNVHFGLLGPDPDQGCWSGSWNKNLP